ncbi:hypothetical protein [Ottowia thiooxydans]|uniref:hypothetical protein n=1 Tax=Ottowia thiooxydans TaxID=219182 RepID=UPI00040F3DC0|nr:hypothetical protein [Ottowia thiooxydans]
MSPATVPAAPIPRSALVASGSSNELIRDLRAIAMSVATDWARSMCLASPLCDHEDFGKKVAQVYLATLRKLEANFGPEEKRDWER